MLNIIISLLILIVFVYALVTIPKALGEMRGIYMEEPDTFFGKFEADCKWNHGATYGVAAFSYIIIMPILVLIFEIVSKNYGLIAGLIIIILIIIPFKLYYNKQSPINHIKAYKKNIEDGYIDEKTPMPKTESFTEKIAKKIKK